MRVEAAAADHVAAGRRHDDAAEAGEQRAGEQERGADAAAELLVELGLVRSPVVSTVTSFSAVHSTSAPMSASSSSIVWTSRIRGTFVSCTGSLASTQAARIGSAPFLFPAARIVPLSGRPPSITKACIPVESVVVIAAVLPDGAGYRRRPMEPTRERAWETLTRYTKSESLLRHALAVEASTRSYARRFGEDEELWGVVALLHDFDYEIHPTLDKHPQDGAPILREEGYPEEVIEAILSHAEHLALPRDTPLKKTLFACDEISGFVHACGLVRPTGLDGLEPKSVKKKLKQPSFAAGVHRDEVYAGAELLGLELDEHIANVVAALQPIAQRARPAHGRGRGLALDSVQAATSRARSSSLVHQPQETRTRPVSGISRTATSASDRRATSAGGSSARKATSVAPPGTSSTCGASSSRQRAASSAARSKRHSGGRPERGQEPGQARRSRSSRDRSAPRPRPARSGPTARTRTARSSSAARRAAAPGRRRRARPSRPGPQSHFWPETVRKSSPSASTGIAPTDCAPSTRIGTPVRSRSSRTGSTRAARPEHLREREQARARRHRGEDRLRVGRRRRRRGRRSRTPAR